MGSQSSDKPKCLSMVKGETLLGRALHACNSIVERKDIIIVAGYRQEMLRDYHPHLLINDEWESTNIMGSLMVADDFLRAEDCLIVYSDILFDVEDLSKVAQSKGPSVLSVGNWGSVWSQRFSAPLEDLEKFDFDVESGSLTDIGGKPESFDEIHGQFGGIWKSTPTLWSVLTARAPQLKKLDTTTALKLCVSYGLDIQVVFGDGAWFEFDHVSDLEAYEGN